MLFGFWKLKTTVFSLLLASCLGHQLLMTCQWDYCDERSVESRNIETDNLRKLYGDESYRAGTARETENLDNISTGLRENRLNQFNSESNREIRRELTTLAENRRQLVRHEPSRRENLDNISTGLRENRLNQFNSESNREIRRELTTLAENRRQLVRHETSRREDYQFIIEIDNRRIDSDFNMRVEEIPKTQRSVKLVLERRQEANTEGFRTPISRLNKRENRQEGNELREENQERRRFNDSRSETQPEILQRTEESQAEREIRDIDRQSRRFSDRVFESERNLLQRRELNPEERESRCSSEQTTNRNPEPVQRRNQIKEESSSLNEVLTRRDHENNRDIARRDAENSETRRFNERVSERTNEIRFENLRSEGKNDRNMDKSRRLSLTEDYLLDSYDSRLDERERNNHRSIQQLSERTHESIQRREGSAQERGNIMKVMQRSSSRLDLTEPPTEQRENLRRLNKRESLDENHRSIEQFFERNQEALQRREINKRERTDNREFERSNSPLSAQRRSTEHENDRSNEHLSNVEDRNERQHNLKTFDENRESEKLSQRIIEREERNVQRDIANDMECERNTERNVRNNKNRRVTSRQDIQEQRYNINKRLAVREFTQRRVGDTRKRENDSRQPAITQQEKRLEVFNRRVEQRSVNAEFNRRQQHRYDDSPERENVLNRNLDSQRFNERLIENIDNRDEKNEHANRIISSRRSEQRNIHRLADENRNSRRIDERRDENGLLNGNILSRRSSFYKNELESVEQRDIDGDEVALYRKELRELEERDNERNINRASEKNVERERSQERFSENIRERYNQNMDESKLQHATNRRLVTRRSNERHDRIESTRNNHQMVSIKGDEATKLQQRRDENKREQREERGNQQLDTLFNRNVENRRDFQFIVDEYKETQTDSLKNSNMAYVQGVLLAIVIMKTLSAKNNIKCQVSQKFQEAIAMLGF